MIKEYRRYRNFMIVFEDDRYYVCKASSFSKDGNNRYSFGDFTTIDDAKKRIDEYYSDNKEDESMRRSVKKESCDEGLVTVFTSGDFDKYKISDEELDACSEKEEVLNEIDDEDDKYIKNFGESCEDDEDLVIECDKPGITTMYSQKKSEEECTNPSSIGQFKRSTIGDKDKEEKIEESAISIQSEDDLKSVYSQLASAPVGTTITINGGKGEWNSDGSKSVKVYKKDSDELWHYVSSTSSSTMSSAPGADDPDWGISFRHLPINGGNDVTISSAVSEDRIITKDDELNKPTNVDDDNEDDTTTSKTTITIDTDSDDNKDDEVVLNEKSDMTDEEKDEWVKNAKPEDLLRTWFSMSNNNSYGRYQDDINRVYKEIIQRMSK